MEEEEEKEEEIIYQAIKHTVHVFLIIFLHTDSMKICKDF